ncbi:MAG: hypothetical protein J7L55_04840 [Desulfurococcales archaeon]|nr:hypothetical protein [Desulfurococcales archaeon]
MPRCSGLEEEGTPNRKRDIKQLVAVIPPASQLMMREGGKVREKRIRLRLKKEVPESEIHVNPEVKKSLGIGEEAEISVSGKKRFKFKAVENESVPQNEVWCNEDFMKEVGIADNSLVTLRGA